VWLNVCLLIFVFSPPVFFLPPGGGGGGAAVFSPQVFLVIYQMTWCYISEGCSLNAMLLYLPECKMKSPTVVKYVELP